MFEHIVVVLSSEDFNADKFLNGITKGWKDLPTVAPSGNPISQPYKNPSPQHVPITDIEILYLCPLHQSEALQKKDCHKVRGVAILQDVSCFAVSNVWNITYTPQNVNCMSSTWRTYWIKCSAIANVP